jgi:hypothetical protein
MTEDEVNLKCREWISKQGYKYKGILNIGLGQVPIPNGERSVLIDHQGFCFSNKSLVWIEAKGEVNLSELLEGFIRVNYAVYEGGGIGYLATPHKQYELLKDRLDFLKAIAYSVNGKGFLGLMDVENNTIIEL